MPWRRGKGKTHCVPCCLYSPRHCLQWPKLLFRRTPGWQTREWHGRGKVASWPGLRPQDCPGGGERVITFHPFTFFSLTLTNTLCLQPEGLPREYTYSVFFCPNGKGRYDIPFYCCVDVQYILYIMKQIHHYWSHIQNNSWNICTVSILQKHSKSTELCQAAHSLPYLWYPQILVHEPRKHPLTILKFYW